MNLHTMLYRRKIMREKARKIDLVTKTCIVIGSGIVIGAGLGMLMAPQSGKETRTSIVNTFNKGVCNLKRYCAKDCTETIKTPKTTGEPS